MRRVTPVRDKMATSFVADPESGCHNWTGANNGTAGYGVVCVAGRNLYAHRVSYELHIGPIPEGLVIDHLCRNPSCVNPAHLEAVTVTENRRRCQNVQRTICAHGHQMSPENTTFVAGRRLCRQCGRDRSKAHYHRVKAKAVELGVTLSNDGEEAGGSDAVRAA